MRHTRLFGGRRVGQVVAAALVVGATGLAGVLLGDTGRRAPRIQAVSTATALVERTTLTSRQVVTGTLGFAGDHVIAVPNATSPSAVITARQNLAVAQQRVRADMTVLSIALSTTRSDESAAARARKGASAALLAARGQLAAQQAQDAATVVSDRAVERTAQSELEAAKAMVAGARATLARDQKLGCPAESSSSTGSSSPAAPGSNTATPSTAGATPTDSGGDVQPVTSTPVLTAAPTVVTGSISPTSTTTAMLTGTVDPGGLATTYTFEYGTTDQYGSVTPATSTAAMTGTISVAANVAGLAPGTTYLVVLAATNAHGTNYGVAETFSTPQTSCATDEQTIRSDRQRLRGDRDGLRVARANLNAARLSERSSTTPSTPAASSGQPASAQGDAMTAAQARAQLSADRLTATSASQALTGALATASRPGATVTALAPVGRVLSRGDMAYAVDDKVVSLLYGDAIPWRTLSLGDAGPDVAELEANLIALGFGHGLTTTGQFSPTTGAAVREWQRSIGVPSTGVVRLGDAIFAPGGLRVTARDAAVGAAVEPGMPLLHATSDTRIVDIALPVEQQFLVKRGDAVIVTLPDGTTTTPGVIARIAPVATSPASSASVASGAASGTSSGATGATIDVSVRLTHPRAAGQFDQAPVQVAVTASRVDNALAVPITALVGEPGGGYDIDVLARSGHRYIPVNVGLFDDDSGLVQVRGSGLHPGQRVITASQ